MAVLIKSITQTAALQRKEGESSPAGEDFTITFPGAEGLWMPRETHIVLPQTDSPRPVFITTHTDNRYHPSLVRAIYPESPNGGMAVLNQPNRPSQPKVDTSASLYPQLGWSATRGHLIAFTDGDIVDLGELRGAFTQWNTDSSEGTDVLAEEIATELGIIPDRELRHDLGNQLGNARTRGNRVELLNLYRRVHDRMHTALPISMRDMLNPWKIGDLVQSKQLSTDQLEIKPEHRSIVTRFLSNTVTNAVEAKGSDDTFRNSDVIPLVGSLDPGWHSPYLAVCSTTTIALDVLPRLGSFQTSSKDDGRGNGLASLAVESQNAGMGLYVVTHDKGAVETARLTGLGNSNGYFMTDLYRTGQLPNTDTTFSHGQRMTELTDFMRAQDLPTAFVLAADMWHTPLRIKNKLY